MAMRKSRPPQRGAALVEFALILPLLLVMVLVVTECGRAIYQYNVLAKTVRDAARYLSVQTPGSHLTEARNLIVYGNTTGTGTALAPGLSLAQVPDPTWQETDSVPIINTVTVQIAGYTFQSMLPSAFGVNFGAIPFGPISATMRAAL